MTPILSVAVLFGIIFTFTDMTVVYILTAGGPFDSTQTLPSLAFATGIAGSDLAAGAAISLFLVPVLVAGRLPHAARRAPRGGRVSARRAARAARPAAPGSCTSSCSCSSRSVLAFPFFWMLIAAFKQNIDLYTVENNPFKFNLPPTLEHVRFLFTRDPVRALARATPRSSASSSSRSRCSSPCRRPTPSRA